MGVAMRWGAVLIVGLSACTDGPEAFSSRGVPEPDGEPALTIEPVAVVDGVAYARAGATLTLTLPVRAIEGLDAQASNVSLTGVELESAGDGLTWTRTLDGSEGDGLKTLDARIADNLGQISRFQDPDIAVTLDFTPPRADCVLAPATANASSNVSFAVLPSEPLAALPTVAAADPDIVLDDPQPEGGGTRWTVSFPDGVDFDPYVLTATATDRAGNPQDGDSLCDPAARTGRRIGQGPQRDGDLQFAATPAVDHDGVPLVREGADLTVSIPLAGTGPIEDRLDLDASVVTLSGIPLDHLGGTTWGRTLTGAEGDGLKDLDARLFDPVGNSLRVQQPGVVRFDFTAPTAACALSPTPAGADDAVRFVLTPSEPLDGPPQVSGAGVTVGLPTVDAQRWTVSIDGPVDTDTAYVLSVSAADRAGNVATDDALCGAADRTGEIRGVRPGIDGAPDLTLVDGPSLTDTPPRVGPGAVIDVSLAATRPLDMGFTSVQLGDLPLAWHAPTDTWRGTVAPDTADGRKALRATLVDTVGNRGSVDRPELAVIVDQSPPEVVSATLSRAPFLASADDGGDTVWANAVDPATGGPVTVTLQILATEDLDGTPDLSVSGPGALAFDVELVTGRLARWRLNAIPAAVDGDFTFAVVLRDALGNRTASVPLTPRLVVDTTPPDPPTTDARVVYDRVPWGDASGGPRAEVTGGDGAVEPAAGVELVSPAGALLDLGTATAEGAFGPLRAPADLPRVAVRQRDRAGNASDSALVRVASWTAATGPGIAASEALTWSAGPRLGAARLDPDWPRTQGPGAPATTEGRPAWAPWTAPTIRSPSEGFGGLDMTLDRTRGRVVYLQAGDTWTWDGRDWARQDTPVAPAQRANEPMLLAHDTARGVTVGFGGNGAPTGRCGLPGRGECNDTWVWDGATWTDVTPAVRPSARSAHALAYDATRGVVVLFGGGSLEEPASCGNPATGLCGDTWVWDGAAWTDVTPAASPSPRAYPAMAWDPVRAEIVLTGGFSTVDGVCGVPGSRTCADTWTWDGATWTLRDPPTPAPDRRRAGIAWDAARAQLVMFGGKPAATCFPDSACPRDTWTWDGSTWTQHAAQPGGPETSEQLAVASTPDGDGVLLSFLGNSRGTWRWDGAAWRRLVVPARPQPREDAVLVDDPVRGEVLLFGGTCLGEPGEACGDTWTWSPQAGWTQHDVDPSPSPRTRAAAAFDPVIGEVILFGGSGCGADQFSDCDDTWAWTGTAWRAIRATAAPVARDSHGMAWHPGRQAVVLYGGNAVDAVCPGGGLVCTDTWAFTGTDWVLLAENDAPGGRDDHVVATDAARGTLLVHGGSRLFDTRADTWTLGSLTWQREADGPSARFLHAAAWHGGLREVLLFGGREDYFDPDRLVADTWTWDGVGWTALAPDRSPSPRAAPGLAAHAEAGVVLFGGAEPFVDGNGSLGDLWTYAGTEPEARPGQVLDVAWSTAAVPEAAIDGLTVRWTAGGRGVPSDAVTDGVDLLVWDDGWQTIARAPAGPDAVDALCWRVGTPTADADPGCVDLPDDDRAARLFARGARREATFAVRPSAPIGDGPGIIHTEAAAVTVHYRLP